MKSYGFALEKQREAFPDAKGLHHFEGILKMQIKFEILMDLLSQQLVNRAVVAYFVRF